MDNMRDVNGLKPEGRARNVQLQNEIDYAAIGRHMRDVRKTLAYTQAQFSELLGMSPNYYGQYETGAQHINIPRFIQFICVTKCSADQLLAGCHADYPSRSRLPEDCSEQRRRLNTLLDKCPDEIVESLLVVAQTMLKQK